MGPEKITALAATVLISLHTAALAQSGALEEVIVTASKRTENLQDVPMAVTTFSDEVIQEAGINSAEDLAILTPSLTVTVNTQPFTAAFRIRGIGTSQTDIALEPSVGIFVDEVFLPRSGLGMSDLTDIERIEVLQGPQGTLYGKNTNAGAVSIHTKRPNLEELEAYVETTAGDYDLRKITASATGPVTDTLAFRLSGNLHQRDGYFDNSGPGDDLNSADDWNVIGKLLWEPTDTLMLQLNGSRVDRDTRCCAADAVQSDAVNDELAARGLPVDQNDPFDHEIAVDVDNEFTLEADALSLVVDYDIDWGAIKSITAWSDSELESSMDVDRSLLDVMYFNNQTGSGDTFSQELRFSSEAGDTIDYQVGLFYYDGKTKGGNYEPYIFFGEDIVTIASQQPPPIGPIAPQYAAPGDSLSAKVKLQTRTFAAFGQSTWHITDLWRVTGGLRWTEEEKDADLLVAVDSTAPSTALPGSPSLLSFFTVPIDDSFSRNKTDTNWLVNTSYDVLDDTMIYASVATGSKSGGFNTVNGTPEQREFDDEDTISYELGVKSTLLDARLRVNAATFFTRIDDYQFQRQVESGFGTIVSNQAEVETSGLDLDVQALPLPNLTLTAGLLYMHEYEVTDGPQKGDDLPFVADFSGTVSATLVFPLADGGLYLRTDYSQMGNHLTSASTNVSARDEQNRKDLNARLGWRNDHWNVSVWGKNLTDDEYAGLTAATLPLTGMDAYFLNPPRTWGVTARYDF